MKTTPMLLRPDMARAWDEGSKTRTQRIAPVTSLRGGAQGLILERNRHSNSVALLRDGIGPVWSPHSGAPEEPLPIERLTTRYGVPGDRINLLTTWSTLQEYDEIKPSELYSVLPHGANLKEIWVYFDSAEKPEGFGKLRPGRFMPKFLRELMPKPKILSLGVRRIHEITDAECLDEGIEYVPREIGFDCYRWSLGEHYEPTPKDAFRKLWDSINGEKYSWDDNPWVFNIEMEGPE